MATVKPFKAYRPSANCRLVACPPYDVIDSAEAKELAAGNPLSFLHVEKPEIDLPAATPLYDEKVYAKGKENLEKFIREGVLKQDEAPYFYIYAQTMNGRTQYGLVAATSTKEYDEGIIRKHELTRKDKEEDRTRHITALQATTGPVFLTYPDQPQIDVVVQKVTRGQSVCQFTSEDGIGHEVWVVADQKDIAAIENAFAQIPTLYIADGHHRSASASNTAKLMKAANPQHTGEESYNFFQSVIFPASQLYIMDYNRLVKDLNGLSPEQFIVALSKDFTVMKTGNPYPEKPHHFGMYLRKQWYMLVAKPGTFDAKNPVESLDVSILQHNVLAKLLGIQDPRTDKRISFVGGIRGVQELENRVNKGEYEVAFSMFPTSIRELMKVADANLIMPPKSTWFEPKLRSGLIVYKY